VFDSEVRRGASTAEGGATEKNVRTSDLCTPQSYFCSHC